MLPRPGRAARRGGGGAAFFIAAAFLAAARSLAAEAAYPLILSLEGRDGDPAFRQYQEDVETGRRLVFNRLRRESDAELAGRLALYRCDPQALAAFFEGVPAPERLQRLAARCSLPYAGIAGLNGLDSGAPPAGALLLPSMPGLFIREDAPSDFERLLLAARAGEGALIAVESGGVKTRYRFIPGADFSPAERALFLNPALFRYPLRAFTVSSPFGSRVSPVSGRSLMHRGLDFAAPEGAEVYAVRGGRVAFAGHDAVYGNYVQIAHDGGWVSLYGHLSEILAGVNSEVRSGTVVGRVGSTGLSTGPHLHFELRKNGSPHDPASLLGRREGNAD